MTASCKEEDLPVDLNEPSFTCNIDGNNFSSSSFSASVNDFDVPSRFLPCLTMGLAFYLAVKKNPDKVALLQPMYEQSLQNALRFDEDRTSVHLIPSVSSVFT